jgi:hypothetical protein
MQINTKQIKQMLKQIDLDAIKVGLFSICPVTDKKVGLGVKLINRPVRTSPRKGAPIFKLLDNMYQQLEQLKTNLN